MNSPDNTRSILCWGVAMDTICAIESDQHLVDALRPASRLGGGPQSFFLPRE